MGVHHTAKSGKNAAIFEFSSVDKTVKKWHNLLDKIFDFLIGDRSRAALLKEVGRFGKARYCRRRQTQCGQVDAF